MELRNVFYSLLGPSLMFFAVTILNPRDRGEDSLDLARYFIDTRRYFLGVMLVIFLLFSFDGPFFGTEQFFSSLRVAQAIGAACIIWGIVSDHRRVHTIIALAILGSLIAGVSIRFRSRTRLAQAELRARPNAYPVRLRSRAILSTQEREFRCAANKY